VFLPPPAKDSAEERITVIEPSLGYPHAIKTKSEISKEITSEQSRLSELTPPTMDRERAEISNSDENNDELFFSDDDYYFVDAYEEDMMNPLLERLTDCNNTPYRIVTITQPLTENSDLQPAAVSSIQLPDEPLNEPAHSQANSNELSKLVEQLSVSQSLQNGHITWLIKQKQEMQRQIDFLHAITSPPRAPMQVCHGVNREVTSEVIAPRRANLETQTRSVGTQTEDPHSAQRPRWKIDISASGIHCTTDAM